MTFHLSTRIVWHDRGWDGCVCDQPSRNVYCIGHDSVGAEFIRKNKDVEWEEARHGRACDELWEKESEIPPCMWTINAFSSRESPVIHVHPFIDSAKRRFEEFPAYSVGTWPYDQMYDLDTRKLEDLETREENAKEFFGMFEPGKSLVFLYLNFDNPLNSENRKYVLVGISRLVKFGPYSKFEGLNPWQTRVYGDRIWSRYVVHGYPSEGVRIPYQEYLRMGKDTRPILIEILGETERRFKYVARDLTDDDACELIERMIAAIRKVDQDGFVQGEWKRNLAWLNQVLAETWTNRGPYPGLGGVLEALGVENGTTLVRKLTKEQPELDLRKHVFECLEGKQAAEWATPRLSRLWKQYSGSVKGKVLYLLTSFDVSSSQIEKIISERKDRTGITSSLSEILENPYVLCEEYRGQDEDDLIGFYTIDNGVFTDRGLEPALKMAPDDPRRVRALMIEKLRQEEGTGNCFLDLEDVLDYVGEKRLDWRRCVTSVEHIRAEQEFYEKPHKLTLVEHSGRTFTYLHDIIDDEQLVRSRIELLIGKQYEASGEDWKSQLRRPHPNIPDDIYERVLRDQAEAIENSYRHRLSVITGAAGTGKTTVIKTLIEGLSRKKPGTSFLPLTPTGKARERLHQATGMKAKTIHRALMENGWLSKYNYRMIEGKTKIKERNIIIDESSMVDLRLLAHLFRSIDWNYVDHVILVGDHNQLPPIGFGRPFFDIFAFLRSSTENADCVSSLSINCRQMVEQSSVLTVANIYTESSPPNFEEILNRIERGEHFKDLEIVFWKDEKELRTSIESHIEKILQESGLQNSEASQAFSDLLGVRIGKEPPLGSSQFHVESFQILTPYRGEYYGSGSLNLWIQGKYRKLWLEKVGTLEGLTAGDKVIQVVNTIKWQNHTQHELFNGQMGYVRFVKREKPKAALVSFQEGGVETGIWFGTESIGSNLELGYAISVHKAQGSEFDVVFLVLPQEKLGLISKELLYTALTRSRKRLVLFLQNNIGPLLYGMDAANSDILLRNTSMFTLRFTSERFRVNDLIHRTDRADKPEYVRSKSEVIIANELLRHNLSYDYENRLYSKDNSEWILPDFTIHHEGDILYWEHLGRLEDPEYERQWERKKAWYETNDYAKNLITSDEAGGFDSTKIVKLIQERIGLKKG